MSPEMDVSMRGSGPGQSEPVVLPPVMDRATVMKGYLGPCLDKVLRPIYQEEITSEEVRKLPRFPIESVEEVVHFGERADDLLNRRLKGILGAEPGSTHYQNFLDLINQSRLNLTFNGSIGAVQEGVRTGITTPLALALQIHFLEAGKIGSANYLSGVETEELIEVLEREEFDGMLMRLTKGPNGFLGSRSSSMAELRGFANGFFTFFNTEDSVQLSVEDAYEMQDGKVVGFSNSFFLAANKKRTNIAESKKRYSETSSSSSGCPVRHNFPDPETGEGQEPLVITAKKFLVAALRASQEKEAT